MWEVCGRPLATEFDDYANGGRSVWPQKPEISKHLQDGDQTHNRAETRLYRLLNLRLNGDQALVKLLPRPRDSQCFCRRIHVHKQYLSVG